jgi:hypothetical protein
MEVFVVLSRISVLKRVAKRTSVTEIVTRFYTNAMVKNAAKFSLVQKYYAHDILAGAFE